MNGLNLKIESSNFYDFYHKNDYLEAHCTPRRYEQYSNHIANVRHDTYSILLWFLPPMDWLNSPLNIV